MTPGRRLALAAGVVTAVAALAGMDRWATHSLTGHMLQHVVLLTVAAPLVALALPWPAGRAWLLWLAAGVVLQSAAMIGWHLPAPFDAALRHDPVHGIEHLTLLGTAVLFWWAVIAASRTKIAAAVVAVFVASLACTAIGVPLVLAARPWYAGYRSLSDQQLAGVIMWALAGAVYVVAGAALFFTWLASVERRAPARLVPLEGSRP
jgi:putative membrane protein